MRKVLDERLTQKQKFIINFLRVNRADNITRLVEFLAKEMECSESCVWNNVNSLKKCGLIQNGLNRPVRLTWICKRVFGGEKR